MNEIEYLIRGIKNRVREVFPKEDTTCVSYSDWTYSSGKEKITYSIWTGRTKFEKEFNSISEIFDWLFEEGKTEAQKILFRRFKT